MLFIKKGIEPDSDEMEDNLSLVTRTIYGLSVDGKQAKKVINMEIEINKVTEIWSSVLSSIQNLEQRVAAVEEKLRNMPEENISDDSMLEKGG